MGNSNPFVALLIALLLTGCVTAPGGSTLPSTTTEAPEKGEGVSMSTTVTTEGTVDHPVTVTYYVMAGDLNNVEVTYRNGTATTWNVSDRGFPLGEVEDTRSIEPTARTDTTIEMRVKGNEARKLTMSGVPTSATLVYAVQANEERVLVGAGDVDCDRNGVKSHHVTIRNGELFESSTECHPETGKTS